MTKEIKVLHIGDEMSWRGGENQTLLLAKGLSAFRIGSVMAYPRESQALDRMKDLFPVVELSSRRPLDPRNILALKKAVNDHQIQIIDAQSSNAASMGLILKKIFPKLKLVVHRRVDVPIKQNPITRWKYLNPAIDHYVAISNAIGKRLTDYGLSPERLSVVPSAIDIKAYPTFERAKERHIWKEKILVRFRDPDTVKKMRFDDVVWIGFAGAIVEEKGIFDLLEAFSLLKKSGVSFLAPIAGDGRDLSAAQTRVNELGLASEVILLSRITEMNSYLSTLDILVLPSHTEGLGTILLDAIAAGVAVVGSDVGGIPEIIRPNETGMLFPVGNVALLSEKLGLLCADKQKRELLVLNAQKHLGLHFSLEKMIQGNLSVFRKILSH